MSPTNKQSKNVGNLGDVLKHAALVRLARALVPRRHVETHAFLLEAPCPDPDRWLRETAAELAAHPGYLDYFRLEHPIVEGRPYICSAGLALEALAPTGPSLVLAESDPPTRATLRAQLEARGESGATVFESAEGLLAAELPAAGGPVLVHVDPFVLDDTLWRSVSGRLDSLAAAEPRVAALVFTHDPGTDRHDWPAASPRLGEPVATIDRRPYHLAVYATAEAAPTAAAAVSRLGWRITA